MTRALVPYKPKPTAIVKRKTTTAKKPPTKVVKKVVRKKKSCPRNYRLTDEGTCASELPCFDDEGNPQPWLERDEYGNCRVRDFGKSRILDPDTMRPISTKSPRGKFLLFQKKYDDAKKYIDRYEKSMRNYGPSQGASLSYKDAFSRSTQLEKQKRMIELHQERLKRIKEEKEKEFGRNAIHPQFFHAMRGWNNP